jgi:uncharacterized membrane protein YgaE (UPF0421/DUF939 family)
MRFRLGTDKYYVNPLWVLLAGIIAIIFICGSFIEAIQIIGILLIGLFIASFIGILLTERRK